MGAGTRFALETLLLWLLLCLPINLFSCFLAASVPDYVHDVAKQG